MTEFALIPENQTFFTSAGDLASGYQLFIYEAGSSTKATTHRDSDGLVANTNPIVLDSLGQTPYGVYVPTGTYKTVFTTDTDTDPPATAIRTRDNITPRNDATAAAQSEWVVGPTPTYTSGTTFTLVGDQTSTFHVGRRLKLVDSGGTSYAVISATAYTSLTTVTVVNDATAIDSGLSAVSYALFDANNLSMPHWSSATTGQHLGSDGTIPVWVSGNATLIETQSASTSSSIEFTTGIDSTYPLYVVRLENVRCASDGDILGAQISQNSTWITSGYKFHSSISLTSTSAYAGTNSSSASLLGGISNNQSSDADHSFSGLFYLPNPSGTVMLQKCYWWGTYIAADDDGVNVYGSGHYTTAAATDRLRFKYNTGNITSGTFTLFGVS